MTGVELPGWQLAYSGKVRDLYVPANESFESSPTLLMVASDRVSAFDQVLEPEIPGKGELLTAMTRFWLRRLDLPNCFADEQQVPAEVAARSMLVANLRMLPVECVVRGRIAGSGFKEYLATGAISGVELPAGLAEGDRLPEPIFTPAWKAPLGEHDENIPFERVVELVGLDLAEAIRDASLDVFARAERLAAPSGLVLADTKFEFGVHRETGRLYLADEVLTSDSSRYWDAVALTEGRIESFDKQIVRDWLAANYSGVGATPRLPDEVVAATAARYRELLDRLTAADR